MAFIGIHLGDSRSFIAKLDDRGHPAIVSVDGERFMASCVYAPKADKSALVVGALARNTLGHEPESVVQHFQGDMGTDKTYRLRHGMELNPVSASAAVIRKLTQKASKELGPIHEVVITVPTYFAERQRKATIEAGTQAGLKVIGIVNEPTAAILAYATQKTVRGMVLIYSFGSGRFDVTIAKVNGSEIECLTSEGDSELGGMDFDQKIAEIIDQKYAERFGSTLRDALGLTSEEDERKSPAWQSLLLEAEKCKKTLSKMPTAPFNFYEGPDGPLKTQVTRQEFERAISSLIAQTEMRVETALDSLNLSHDDIDEVLLVGGSSRVPAVKESLRRQFGKEPLEGVNPDEAVALGAAIYAGLQTDKGNLKPKQREKLSKVSVVDVANHNLGTISVHQDEELGSEDLRLSIIIPKNTPLPCSKTKTFYTMYEGQKFFRCRVTQSANEEDDPDFVTIIMDGELGPFPPGRAAQQPIEMTFSYDLDQTIHVRFRDVNSGMVLTLTPGDKQGSITRVPDFRIEEMEEGRSKNTPKEIFVPDIRLEYPTDL